MILKMSILRNEMLRACRRSSEIKILENRIIMIVTTNEADRVNLIYSRLYYNIGSTSARYSDLRERDNLNSEAILYNQF